MDSNQLNCYAEMLKIADFLGVYASDELSSIPTLETGMLIFNTDPSKKSGEHWIGLCLLYTSPSPRDTMSSRMPSSA